MRHKTKSIIISRKPREHKDDDLIRPCIISLFDHNDPHKNPKEPKEILEFKKVHNVIINTKEIHFLLAGNDLVINNLKHIDLIQRNGHLIVKAKKSLF